MFFSKVYLHTQRMIHTKKKFEKKTFFKIHSSKAGYSLTVMPLCIYLRINRIYDFGIYTITITLYEAYDLFISSIIFVSS